MSVMMPRSVGVAESGRGKIVPLPKRIHLKTCKELCHHVYIAMGSGVYLVDAEVLCRKKNSLCSKMWNTGVIRWNHKQRIIFNILLHEKTVSAASRKYIPYMTGMMMYCTESASVLMRGLDTLGKSLALFHLICDFLLTFLYAKTHRERGLLEEKSLLLRNKNSQSGWEWDFALLKFHLFSFLHSTN